MGHRDYVQWWCDGSVAVQVAFVKGPMQPGQLVGLLPWLAGPSHPCPGQSSSVRALSRAELTALPIVGAVERRGSSISLFLYPLFPPMCINLLLVLGTEPL